MPPLTQEEAQAILNGLTPEEITLLAAEAYLYCNVSDGLGAPRKRRRLISAWGDFVVNRNARQKNAVEREFKRRTQREKAA